MPIPTRTPRNGCSACGADFSKLSYFDQHRVGVHAFTFSEGLKLDPPRDDGRRCLDAEEMLAAGLSLDANGRWTNEAKTAATRAAFGAASALTSHALSATDASADGSSVLGSSSPGIDLQSRAA
jgi:hypothetical protein